VTLAAFLTVAVLHLFVAISPGPAVLMAARIGVTEGFRTGMALACGIAVGAVSWAMAAMFGLSLLFEYARFALTAIKLVGAAYLLWMAWHMWRDAATPLEITDEGGARKARSAWSAFRLGVLTQYSNPKAAVMFSSLFIGTVPPGTNWTVIAALMVVVFLNEAIWNTLVARIFSLDASRRTYLGLKATIDRCFGGMLAVLGVKIAVMQ
jgi:threonine/homoserine/homoserine lactone efflux protein